MIDTLVMLIADPGGGKSNQIRSVFQCDELMKFHNGYPSKNNITRHYQTSFDVEVFVRLASWHEAQYDYKDVVDELKKARKHPKSRLKVLVPAQVSPTQKLVGGEDLFIKLVGQFPIRRAFAIWLCPDASGRVPIGLSTNFAAFLSSRHEVSALWIDALALHPSAAPSAHSINSRLLGDLLFRA